MSLLNQAIYTHSQSWAARASGALFLFYSLMHVAGDNDQMDWMF